MAIQEKYDKCKVVEVMQEDKKELKIALKKYLGQYYRAKMKQAQLKMRLHNFRVEMTGVKGIQYSPTAHSSSSSSKASETEIQVMRAIEIEERIKAQQEEVQKAMLAVMEIMDFLPLNSMERMILEYRHVDCLSWKGICIEVGLARTPCNRYYNTGLDRLLMSSDIQLILKKFYEL